MFEAISEKNSYLKLTETKKLCITAIFIVLGILIPFVAGHAFGIQGTMFLPMHIPVLLCGVVCGYKYGGMCGIIVPTLSFLFTRMPGVMMLPIMLVELTIYGLAIGFLVQKVRLNIFISLPLAMILGRMGYAIMYSLLTYTEGNAQILTVYLAFITGIPGICIQIFLIPTCFIALKKSVLNKYLMIDKSIYDAVTAIQNGEASVVVVKRRKVIYKAFGNGVAALIDLYENHKGILKNAYVIDNVIGRGAAIILAKGKVKGVYTLLLSKKAISVLEDRGIKYSCNEETEHIINRSKTDMCPIEKAVIDETDLELGYEKIKVRLEELKKNEKV